MLPAEPTDAIWTFDMEAADGDEVTLRWWGSKRWHVVEGETVTASLSAARGGIQRAYMVLRHGDRTLEVPWFIRVRP